MNEKLNAKTLTLKFVLGIAGGLGSIFASYAAWNWLGIANKSAPPAIAKPVDKDGWPKSPSDECRLFLNACKQNCIQTHTKQYKEDGKEANLPKITDKCIEECWSRRLGDDTKEGKMIRQLCREP